MMARFWSFIILCWSQWSIYCVARGVFLAVGYTHGKPILSPGAPNKLQCARSYRNAGRHSQGITSAFLMKWTYITSSALFCEFVSASCTKLNFYLASSVETTQEHSRWFISKVIFQIKIRTPNTAYIRVQ